MKRLFMIGFFLCALLFSTPTIVHADTTETTDTRTPYYNTDNNNVSSSEMWNAVKDSIMEFQDEVDLIANILIGAFVILASIAFIINTLRLSTAPSHPIQKRKLMIDLIMNLAGVALLGGIGVFVKFIIFASLGI